jgi:hypothetical protein
MDDWNACDAEAVVAALSVRYRFSRANAVQLLRDEGILPQRDEEVEDAEEWEDEGSEDDGALVIPMPGQDLIAVGAAAVGAGGDEAFLDGAAEGARFAGIIAMLRLPDGRVLVADIYNHRIRVLSTDLQQVSTVAGCGPAGAGSAGHQDGAAAQAEFSGPCGLALLPDGRVLVSDFGFNGIRMLSADLQQVSTVAGDGEQGHQDGAAAQATFFYPRGMAVLPDGCVLVADGHNHSIRMLSANLQQVTTVAGDGHPGHQDGDAAQAQFRGLYELVVLPSGCVLVADIGNCCIRMLSADLQQVSTLAGDAAGAPGYQDGAAAVFGRPSSLAVLHDGRVLVADGASVRVLSAAGPPDVSTLAIDGVDGEPQCFEILPDGRVLVATASKRIHVLEGFPPAPAPPKPAAKPPKKKQKRA